MTNSKLQKRIELIEKVIWKLQYSNFIDGNIAKDLQEIGVDVSHLWED